MGRHKNNTTTEVVRLWELGLSDEEIAVELGLKVSSVQSTRCRMGCINGRPITKSWLYESGIGYQWDAVCERFKR